ncbi:uncharacterized protein EDB93DRAFT_66232 [Suillus bovinus]|uniref:uncharacterized protein n=1 Tax=Suillus bovinus TaxID=48563 RepID=UPI001B877D3B|nr:uncharacterized protein EDB93DRAFT_66232 [Suillus bovinus]KAG2156001.1 hypothetical protein EDB93DRAFT_66232 [Suillus bovinus]
MFKLNLPAFSSPTLRMRQSKPCLSVAKTYLAWSALNPVYAMSSQLLIVLAGLQLEEPRTRFWCQNCDVSKQLVAWEEFGIVSCPPVGVLMPSPASTTSRKTSIASAGNMLGSAGDGYAISGSISKNHLFFFFFSNAVLHFRVQALSNFAYKNLTVDALVNAMATLRCMCSSQC